MYEITFIKSNKIYIKSNKIYIFYTKYSKLS